MNQANTNAKEIKLLGKGIAPPQEPKLLVARGKTYDASADRANAALERLAKAMPSRPESEMLIVGHGV